VSPVASVVAISRNEAETRAIGERLGRVLWPGDVVLLHGDLGAGKTTLAQGIARGLGVAGYVQSPTFTLVHEHDGLTADGAPVRLYHLDLYRLGGEEDLDSFGFDDYLAPSDGITLIEWPERAASRLPGAYLLVRLAPVGAGERRIEFEAAPANGPLGERLRAWQTPGAG
jgi:tRNA threonylcarbamoyladenosine biosynthesis protein TsaE